jgi:ADP-glucose pyrophosphorylase
MVKMKCKYKLIDLPFDLNIKSLISSIGVSEIK